MDTKKFLSYLSCFLLVVAIFLTGYLYSLEFPMQTQPIVINDPTPNTPEPKKQPQSVYLEYIIKSGDTLSSLAQKYSTTTKKIQEMNSIVDVNKIEIGTKIVIHPNSIFESEDKYIWPIRDPQVSSEFGDRRGKHRGIDLKAVQGTPIFASADGIVIFSGVKSGYGNVVIVQHLDNVRTLYAHTNKNYVSRWQDVSQGDLIAEVGSTGNARGNHIHFEFIRKREKLNPRNYLGSGPLKTKHHNKLAIELASQSPQSQNCHGDAHLSGEC